VMAMKLTRWKEGLGRLSRMSELEEGGHGEPE
jgi:hypothetical protein